ncbi:MAG TPA: sulfite exporter TauE/SafE family protein [Planctomycetaceae bacterium]|nr:sulfite exporter TauE/SafE family protein [Planctomycetaceae bacterium]
MPMLSLLFGSIVGVSLGLTGGGGAIFAVPLLVYGLSVGTREAVTVSLVSVGLTSFVGFLNKWRHGHVELQTGILFAVAGMLGAPVGSWTARQIPETALMILFAVLMLAIAVRMWMKAGQAARMVVACAPGDPSDRDVASFTTDGPSCQRDASGRLIVNSRCARLLIIVGILSGVMAGMFGVGGGFIIVPALVLFSSMSMIRAVGTSLMVISMVSVSGVTSQLWTGTQIPWELTGLFVAGGLAGLFAGQSISHHLSSVMLQRMFSIAILLVAVFVISRNIVHG